MQEFAKVDSEYLFNTLNSEETPYTFSVLPASTNETACHLYDATHTANAIVNVLEVHNVFARDIFGNLQDDMSDVFTVTISNDQNSYTGSVAPLSNGLYKIEYTIPVAGLYTLKILVQPAGVGPAYEIKDSGLPVRVAVNEVDASLTTLTGGGVTDSIAGEVTSFTVTLFDSGNNQREIGGDLLLVEISDGVTDIETFDNADGTYHVDYKINDASITHGLSVTINGDTSNTKTSTIVTVPNLPHSSSSTMSTDTLIVLDVDQTVDVQVYDAFGNPTVVKQNPIVLVVSGHDKNLYFTFA